MPTPLCPVNSCPDLSFEWSPACTCEKDKLPAGLELLVSVLENQHVTSTPHQPVASCGVNGENNYKKYQVRVVYVGIKYNSNTDKIVLFIIVYFV